MRAVTVAKPAFLKPIVVLVVTVPFLALFAAIILLWNRYVFASDLALFGVLYLLTGLGVTIGYHRMLTHQSFQTHPPIKAMFLILGCMAFEGGPLNWSATHVFHHAHSDEEGDPHSPLEGFWHAHMGWLFRDHMEDPKTYVPQLLQDRTIVFVDRFSWLWPVLSLVIPFVVGGWTGLIWGGFVRMFFTHHVTWSVNSVCHTFGNRAFETTDASRNNWIIGLLGFGEGWHNNHHAFPTNAFHGMRWWQFDLSGLVIRTLERTGLAWKVQRVSREAEEEHKVRAIRSQEAASRWREQFWQSVDNADREIQGIFGSVLSTVDHENIQQQLDAYAVRIDQIRSALRSPMQLKRQKMAELKRELEDLLAQARQLRMKQAA